MSEEVSHEIRIDSHVFNRIKNRVPHTKFDDERQYVEYVLKQILHNIEESMSEDDLEQVDESEVQERLKSLGYLNE